MLHSTGRSGQSARRVTAQIRKEFTQILRDPTSLMLAVMLPLILMSLLGRAISLDVFDIPIIVQDLDQTPTSRSLTDVYRASLTFRVVEWPVQVAPVKALEANTARGAVIIPEHFERDVLKGRPSSVQVLVDATDANTANILRGSLTALTASFSSDLVPPHASTDDTAVAGNTRLWYNPGRSDAAFIGPGAFVVALALLPPLIAALATSRERERNTILQVYVCGVSAAEYLSGKLLAYAAISTLDWLLGVGLLRLVFGLSLRGEPTSFFVGSVGFVFATIAFGVMVGARVTQQTAAIQAMQLGGFVLSFLLSGFIFPLTNIPIQLRWISTVVPARWYLEVVRDAFLRGGGWPAVWPAVGALFVLGGLFSLGAWAAMRRMQLKA